MTCWVWLAIASEVQKSFIRKNVFTLPVSFTGSYTPRMSQILLGKIIRLIPQKKEGVSIVGCEFQGLFKT